MIYAAILAGGSGTRMGNTEKPKQFLEIGGKPVIVRTVSAFAACDEVDRLLVVTPENWVDHTCSILKEHLSGHRIYTAAEYLRENTERYAYSPNGSIAFNKADMKKDPSHMPVIVLAGGETRNETLMNAIRIIDEEGCLDDDSIIVTQDAVRPFVTRKMIVENIEAAVRSGACETAFPATDTIIETDDNRFVAKVPDRTRLWMTQTPQSFRARKLRDLYLSLTEEEKAILTDAAKIFVMKGEPVEIVMGAASNIKITYPDDLSIAEAILKNSEEKTEM